jgi:hypothetical protein
MVLVLYAWLSIKNCNALSQVHMWVMKNSDVAEVGKAVMSKPVG